MTESDAILLRAKHLLLVRLGPAQANGFNRDGSPSIRYLTRERERGAIFYAPNKTEASRQVASGGAVPFEPEPGSKLAELIPAVLGLGTRAEAAEIGATIRDARVWRGVRGPDGFWRPAQSETGFGPLTDASFRDLEAVRQFWKDHPKATPVFILREREGTRAFAYVADSLVEALRY